MYSRVFKPGCIINGDRTVPRSPQISMLFMNYTLLRALSFRIPPERTEPIWHRILHPTSVDFEALVSTGTLPAFAPFCTYVCVCVRDCRVTDSLLPSTWGGASLTQPLEYGHNERTWQHISLALLASQFPLWETAQGLHSEWPHKRPDSLNARQAHGQLGGKCHTVRGMPIIRHTHLLSGPSKPCQSPHPPPRQPHTQPDTELTNRALRLWQNIINSVKGERRVHSVLPNLIGFDIKDVSQL